MAVRALSTRTKRDPNGHRISPADYARGHIGCLCGYRARYCEYSRWTMCTRQPERGIAFYYWCELCWETPGPIGTTPKQRAFSAERAAA